MTLIPWSVYSNTIAPNDADQGSDQQQIKTSYKSTEELPNVDSLIHKSPTTVTGREITANDTQLLNGVPCSSISSSAILDLGQAENAQQRPAAVDNSKAQKSDARSILRLHLSPRSHANNFSKNKGGKGGES